jgi:hypothetical protein
MLDQFVNRPKVIEPQAVPASWVVAYTRCLPAYGTVVKSLSETQPDFGVARGPVDVHRYLEGSAHVAAVLVLDGPLPDGRLVGALDGDVLVTVRGDNGAGLAAASVDGCALPVPADCSDGLAAQPTATENMAAAMTIANPRCQRRRSCDGDIGVSPIVR